MPKDVRFTIRMSSEVHDMLCDVSDRHDRDKGSMVRWLIRLAYSVRDVGDCSSIVRQSCVSEASTVRQLSQLEAPGTEVALQSTQKEEKKKEEKKERRLAPLDLSQRILDDLNKRAGSNFQARGKVARQNIAARLAEGYTEADFCEVHRKMCVLWLGTDMAQYLNYETLYGNKFAKYLGQPEPRAPLQSPLFEPEDEVPPPLEDEDA
jgi:uncharacterized phage protein (TIGR02220 family)